MLSFRHHEESSSIGVGFVRVSKDFEELKAAVEDRVGYDVHARDRLRLPEAVAHGVEVERRARVAARDTAAQVDGWLPPDSRVDFSQNRLRNHVIVLSGELKRIEASFVGWKASLILRDGPEVLLGRFDAEIAPLKHGFIERSNRSRFILVLHSSNRNFRPSRARKTQVVVNSEGQAFAVELDDSGLFRLKRPCPNRLNR